MNSKISIIISLFICFTLLFLSPVQSALIFKRSAEAEKPECQNNIPCGWAIYKNTRQPSIDYFMKNACECPANKKCIRVDDDVTLSAFIYRCRIQSPGHKTSASTNESDQS